MGRSDTSLSAQRQSTKGSTHEVLVSIDLLLPDSPSLPSFARPWQVARSLGRRLAPDRNARPASPPVQR